MSKKRDWDYRWRWEEGVCVSEIVFRCEKLWCLSIGSEAKKRLFVKSEAGNGKRGIELVGKWICAGRRWRIVRAQIEKPFPAFFGGSRPVRLSRQKLNKFVKNRVRIQNGRSWHRNDEGEETNGKVFLFLCFVALGGRAAENAAKKRPKCGRWFPGNYGELGWNKYTFWMCGQWGKRKCIVFGSRCGSKESAACGQKLWIFISAMQMRLKFWDFGDFLALIPWAYPDFLGGFGELSAKSRELLLQQWWQWNLHCC